MYAEQSPNRPAALRDARCASMCMGTLDRRPAATSQPRVRSIAYSIQHTRYIPSTSLTFLFHCPPQQHVSPRSYPPQMPTRELLTAALLAACAASPLAAQTLTPVHTDSEAIAEARADSAKRPYTAADIAFVSGMIHHHAQAILMSAWGPTHDASPDVRTLCARIINAQLDEIHRMQQWLADRRQPVPWPQFTRDTAHTAMADMPGMHHMHDMSGDTLMPGMLSGAQLDTLDRARGADFDRLFLRYMMQHHRGAVGMVRQLFATYGAGQDETIFKMATDINVDQTTEIARMQRMLIGLTLGIAPPPS